MMVQQKVKTSRLQADGKLEMGNAISADLATVTRPSVGRGSKTPKARRPAKQFDLNKRIVEDVRNYNKTNQYIKARDSFYANKAALDRINLWIEDNRDHIDPVEQAFCAECGDVELHLCEHRLVKVPDVIPPAAPVQPPAPINWRLDLSKTFSDMWRWPTFDFNRQNNQYLSGFDNSLIGDGMLLQDLYNYVTVNMQTSYMVNGRVDRQLRLAHCHRLAHRWAEAYKKKDLLVTDTVFKNRFLFTVQRAADNAENTMLFAETSPYANFGLAWCPGSPVLKWLLFMILSAAVLKLGYMLWVVTLPLLTELVIGHYTSTIRLVLYTFLYGSVHLFQSMMALIPDLLEALTDVLATLVCELFLLVARLTGYLY